MMILILLLYGVTGLCLVQGFQYFQLAQSAIHEIEAMLFGVMAAVTGTGAIVATVLYDGLVVKVAQRAKAEAEAESRSYAAHKARALAHQEKEQDAVPATERVAWGWLPTLPPSGRVDDAIP